MPCRYLGLRVEAMTDLMYIFDRRPEKRWSVPVFVGPELGWMSKKDIDRTLSVAYFGVTYGAQVDYRFFKNLSFYLEPRMSVVPYAVTEKSPITELETRTTYYDYLFNLNFGIKYTL